MPCNNTVEKCHLEVQHLGSCHGATIKTNLHGQIRQHIFTLSFITEGTIEKVLQFAMPLRSICNKNFLLNEELKDF
jgi:hypothetical protein